MGVGVALRQAAIHASPGRDIEILGRMDSILNCSSLPKRHGRQTLTMKPPQKTIVILVPHHGLLHHPQRLGDWPCAPGSIARFFFSAENFNNAELYLTELSRRLLRLSSPESLFGNRLPGRISETIACAARAILLSGGRLLTSRLFCHGLTRSSRGSPSFPSQGRGTAMLLKSQRKPARLLSERIRDSLGASPTKPSSTKSVG